MKKVILAYSGGLDTSCAIKWLKEKGFDVICFIADLGQGDDFDKIETRGLAAGASKVYIKDLRAEFVENFVTPALKANAIYEGKYLLATALGRPLIAKYLVEVAHKEKASYISHGCTGKGNDQVRLELSVSILDPKLNIIAPLREWNFKSREEEIEYAKNSNIPIDVTKKRPYSIDKNIWGISIEAGVLEDIEKEPPEDAYILTKNPARVSETSRYVEIYFEKGIPAKLDGKSVKFIDMIETLNKIGAIYGIGRSDLIENRLVGIKSREIYEAPAATIFYAAHKELENLVLDRELAHFKELVALKYSELVYYGLWFSRLKEALDKFVDSTQKFVTGSVKLKLSGGYCAPVLRKSEHSLYKKEMATYTKDDKFDHSLAEGFIKIFGMPYHK
ncbi:MAG: argininosuccinate synthase [Candidatus Omnitrophica bacterium]|nr:argininosuccinate synthase [Candidatus Omnitrophota bacterium]